jgi:hypothetical protein
MPGELKSDGTTRKRKQQVGWVTSIRNGIKEQSWI